MLGTAPIKMFPLSTYCNPISSIDMYLQIELGLANSCSTMLLQGVIHTGRGMEFSSALCCCILAKCRLLGNLPGAIKSRVTLGRGRLLQTSKRSFTPQMQLASYISFTPQVQPASHICILNNLYTDKPSLLLYAPRTIVLSKDSLQCRT